MTVADSRPGAEVMVSVVRGVAPSRDDAGVIRVPVVVRDGSGAPLGVSARMELDSLGAELLHAALSRALTPGAWGAEPRRVSWGASAAGAPVDAGADPLVGFDPTVVERPVSVYVYGPDPDAEPVRVRLTRKQASSLSLSLHSLQALEGWDQTAGGPCTGNTPEGADTPA